MSRMLHFGWFLSRGFGPQGWGHDRWDWGYDWRLPELYQQSARTAERAGLDLVVIEDAVSMGSPDTLDLRARSAYGTPKHDPLMLSPYLFAATSRIGIAPTVNAGITPPYLAARQFASLQHLSGGRVGINVVTDVRSARHVGLPELDHDSAYERADEWTALVRRLWASWGDGALVADTASGRFADASRIDAFQHRGRHFSVDGPLNAVPFDSDAPTIVSPGGSGQGLAFAGAHSQVQLALAPLSGAGVAGTVRRVRDAAVAAGRRADDIRVLFVVKPEIVSSREEADRVVAASRAPGDAEILAVLEGQSSDLETDLTTLDLDAPFDPRIFGDHVSRGTIRGLLGTHEGDALATLRQIATSKAAKGRVSRREGLVGTADEVADLLEELGEAGADGFLFSGDFHPSTLHGMLGDLVPVLRRRGLLRRELGDGGLHQNLFDF